MFGHDCSHYFPKDSKKGDEFICMCSAKWVCIRTFPWAKWNCVGRKGDQNRKEYDERTAQKEGV
jgi:hypothetical protein